MPSERAPKTFTIRHGDKKWVIDREEMRLREGAVDENGMRHTPYVKDTENSGQDAAMVNRYRQLGYEIKDEGYQYIFSIKNSIFLERERARHAKAEDQSRPRKDKELAADGIDANLEVLQSMKAEDFATSDL